MSVVGPSGREFRGCLKEWGIATDEPTKGCIDVGDFILMSAPNRYRKMGSSFEWTRECILAIQKEEWPDMAGKAIGLQHDLFDSYLAWSK